MKTIIEILMKRDDMTCEEAKDLIQEVREMMLSAIEEGRFFEAEEIFESELGLEPDYIFGIL